MLWGIMHVSSDEGRLLPNAREGRAGDALARSVAQSHAARDDTETIHYVMNVYQRPGSRHYCSRFRDACNDQSLVRRRICLKRGPELTESLMLSDEPSAFLASPSPSPSLPSAQAFFVATV